MLVAGSGGCWGCVFHEGKLREAEGKRMRGNGSVSNVLGFKRKCERMLIEEVKLKSYLYFTWVFFFSTRLIKN